MMRQLSPQEAFPYIRSVLAMGDLGARWVIAELSEAELAEARGLAASYRMTLGDAARLVTRSRR